VGERNDGLTAGSFERALRPAGASRARAARAARVAGAVALGAGGVALLGAWLWPLPEPAAPGVATPGSAPASLPGEESIEARRDRLAALSSAGNVFAPDRAAWPSVDTEDEAVAQAEDEPDASGDDQASSASVADASGGAPALPEDIPLTARPTAAASKSLDALALRGVLAVGDRRIAMIQGGEPGDRKKTYVYREGDEFYGETWRVLRVDASRDRVILEHLSHGDVLALEMYDASATAVASAAEDGAPKGPEVASRTSLQARDDLREGGVPDEDVDELFELVRAMERGETPEVEDDAAAAEDEPSADDRTKGLPPAMAQLLRSMLKDAAGSPGSGEQPETDEPEGDNRSK